MPVVIRDFEVVPEAPHGAPQGQAPGAGAPSPPLKPLDVLRVVGRHAARHARVRAH